MLVFIILHFCCLFMNKFLFSTRFCFLYLFDCLEIGEGRQGIGYAFTKSGSTMLGN